MPPGVLLPYCALDKINDVFDLFVLVFVALI